MALRAYQRILRRFNSGSHTIASRSYSTTRRTDQTRFSYYLSRKDEPDDLLTKLSGSAVLENTQGHNAAVVLLTPDFAKQLYDPNFTSRLVRLLTASANIGSFHLLSAIVDSVTPGLGDAAPRMRGVSVLRGHLDDLLPKLWQKTDHKQKADEDSVAALSFSLGQPTVTLPLTRTTFHNHRPSTLLTSRYDVTQNEPELKEKVEIQSQRINISLSQSPRSIADLGLWAPLSPVTRARKITESFGNILRGVEVDGKSIPASTELEHAINTIVKQRQPTSPGPMGVWAMITPGGSRASSRGSEDPEPNEILDGKDMSRAAVEAAANYIQQQFQGGGRIFQVVSGGGGWGPKKGLLSLEPQQTHFALSEEEEMDRFVRTMDNSGFAPTGFQVQFFIPALAPPEATASSATGVMFGVPSNAEAPGDVKDSPNGYLVVDHFGALSSQGVYISGLGNSDSTITDESKLSVPSSRVFVGNPEAKAGRLFRFLGAGGLADAGTAVLM